MKTDILPPQKDAESGKSAQGSIRVDSPSGGQGLERNQLAGIRSRKTASR